MTDQATDPARYPCILEWADDEQTWYVTYPDLPGCMSDGATREEALANGDDAVAAWLAAAREDRRETPAPGSHRRQAAE